MVSFRFHLVSLVAVFLALGLGVLTGTTVLNRGIVAQLQRQTDALSSDLSGLRGDVARLRSESVVWSEFGEQMMPSVLAGRLAALDAIVVTQDGTDDDSIAGVERALEEAGAQVLALLSVSDRMALATDADRVELAGIVGEEVTTDPPTLRARAAQVLADRLSAGPTGVDELEELLRTRFLLNQGPGLGDAALRDVGLPGQIVVVVAGGPASSRVDPASFLVPLVSGLARRGSAVAAAEPAVGEDQEPPFVTLIRTDGDVASQVATQDNVDQLPGQVSLVVALEDLLQGTPGHYGVKDGASAPFPEL
ncbi:MAG TPA: copper transporter [Actinomycetota bacterium]|nr:copper transporter [Actinomycetota bacterium]